MSVKIQRILFLPVIFLLLSQSREAWAEKDRFLPVSQIKPGMTGYGLTVFSGFKIERFKVRVIDVMKNFLPKQDLILIRVDHPVIRKTGVIAGMSGSPIFIQNKLVGALAYGWRFTKEPVAGVTPIANMLAITHRQQRGLDNTGYVNVFHSKWRALAEASRSELERWWKLPFSRSSSTENDSAMMKPVAVPLNAAGLTEPAIKLLKDAFKDYGFEPVQGSGTGSTSEGPKRFVEGGAIGVQMVSGDMSIAGTGTVTYVDKNKVLAFGHQLFNAGEIYLPTIVSKVNHCLASLARSFKLASPARPLGSLVQDRQAGIFVDSSKRIDTLPMTVTMTYQGKKRIFNTKLARHELLTPNLAVTVLSSALSETLPDVSPATISMTTRLTLRKLPQVKIQEYMFADTGPRVAPVMLSRGLRAVHDVLSNDFEPVNLDRIDIAMDVKFARDLVEITEIHTSSNLVEPGSRINVNVTFKPYGGYEFTQTYPLKIPKSLAGSLLVLEAASGQMVNPVKAPPQTLRQFLKDLEYDYPARSLVISLLTPTQGIKLRGEVIRDLPNSVLDTFNTGTHIREGALFQTVIHHLHTTQRIIAGKKQIRLRVKKEVND